MKNGVVCNHTKYLIIVELNLQNMCYVTIHSWCFMILEALVLVVYRLQHISKFLFEIKDMISLHDCKVKTMFIVKWNISDIWERFCWRKRISVLEKTEKVIRYYKQVLGTLSWSCYVRTSFSEKLLLENLLELKFQILGHLFISISCCKCHEIIWVRSRNCGCLVTWFCYQLIVKPGNKTAVVSWPDPYVSAYFLFQCSTSCLKFPVKYT